MMSSSSPDAAPESSFRLGYVTDVEGNLDYFLRYVEHSKVLTIRHHTPLKLELQLEPDCYFVFGGDAVDKGPGDIRLVRALVDLKRRYPDRVVLLVGNRDLNKLRLTAELAQDDMERPMRDIPPPHWDPSAPSLLEFLQEKQQQSTTTTTLEDLNTRVNRLHYMLQHTLGCPNTFEFRRQELAILTNKTNSSTITDDQVLQSFLDEIKDEHGSLRQYLECAQVAVVIGHTLFCHGAVDVRTMQFVPRHDTKFENPPSQPPPAFMEPNVHKWTHALNEYLQVGLDDHRQRPYWNAHRDSRGGEALMALQNRPAMWGRSIISNCYGDGGCITTRAATVERESRVVIAQEETTNPLVFEKVCSDPMDASVAEWLLLTQNSIRRVVVGHKPTGDCPAVLSAAYTGVEIVSADTSFSDTSCADNRGQAVSVVELVGFSDKDNQLELRGVLRNGQAYDCQFPRLTTEEGMDPSVGDAQLGRQVFLSNNHNDGDDEGWWVKVATPDFYWLTRGSGRKVEYKSMGKEEFAKVNATLSPTG